jgi:hypothetical protein
MARGGINRSQEKRQKEQGKKEERERERVQREINEVGRKKERGGNFFRKNCRK